MPSPLRPSESSDPFAVYRHTGGVLSKKAVNKRVAPISACHERFVTSWHWSVTLIINLLLDSTHYGWTYTAEEVTGLLIYSRGPAFISFFFKFYNACTARIILLCRLVHKTHFYCFVILAYLRCRLLFSNNIYKSSSSWTMGPAPVDVHRLCCCHILRSWPRLVSDQLL